MSTGFHNKPRSSIAGFHYISSLASLLLLTLMIGSIFFTITHPTSAQKAVATTSFTFTAVGDYGQTSNTTANLQYIGKSVANGGPGASFDLGLGDFNYSYPSVKPAQWVSFAQASLPANFPLEMTEGDHDTGDMSGLIADMPNQMPNVSGTYGQEYYFDYPASTPFARFIMVSPGISGNYNLGGADYGWVSNTIDAARSAGISWIIVGMAEGCLFINGTSSSTPCPTGGDLLNLLVKDHVDLILQAHVHNYQASNELALNNSCTSIPTDNTFNKNCVVTTSNNMTQGGTVIVNVGTGGRNLVDLNGTKDLKSGYFRTWMGSNVSPTFGVSQITLSATQLTEQFVPLSKGTYKDSFTISNSGATPTPTASPSVTPSPSITPMPSLGQDNFTRADQTYWGTATDGQSWGNNANSLKVFSIKSNTGLVSATSTNNYYATLGPPAIDAQVQFSGSINSFTNANFGAVLRWADTQDWYEALIDGTNLTIEKKVAGAITKLKSVSFAATPATSYTVLFSITGTSLSASAWPSSGTQPATWMVTTTDSSLAATGSTGLHVVVQSGTIVSFTAYQANSLP